MDPIVLDARIADCCENHCCGENCCCQTELAEIPVWELRSLGQVEDGGSPTLSVALNQYHVLRELRSRTVTPGFGWASGRGVFWMPREDVDWERIRAFFPEEGA